MSLSRRLTLTVVVASLVTALVLSLGALVSTRTLFDRYVQETASGRQQALVQTMAAYYRDQGSWQGVQEFLNSYPFGGPMGGPFAGSGVGGSGRGSGNGMGPGMGRRGAGSPGGAGSGLGGGSGTPGSPATPMGSWALLDQNGQRVAWSQTSPLDPNTGLPGDLSRPINLPIPVNGQVVGRLLLSGELGSVLNAVEAGFRQSLLIWLVVSGLVALGVGALAGWFSAATLRRRAAALAVGAAAVGSRAFDVRVPEEGHDELGLVARSFNRMAEDLQRSELARRNLLADVAHELRTPVAVLRGQLELLEDGVVEPSPATFRSLQDDTLRLTRLVSDLEQLSLAEAGRLTLHWRAFAPGEWLAQEVEVFRPAAADQGVALTCEVAADLPQEVEGDSDRLGQVVTNLLSNALRHTPAGGAIAVSAAAREGGWGLTVRDSGEGIAPEDLPHVFDRFYRAPRRLSGNADGAGAGNSESAGGGGTDGNNGESSGNVTGSAAAETAPIGAGTGSRRGSGLGLAIVRGLVQAHGGNAWAESTLGQGSAFHVWLPLRRSLFLSATATPR